MTAARRARCLVRGVVLAASLVPAALGGAVAGELLVMPTALDRVAYAIDGAESSHGRDMAMWRPDPAGPQGPMQVCEKAEIDVGGGDRFDLAQNRAIGRTYLAQLYRRYGNWADAIAAYNWGIGNLDGWIRTGRSDERLLSGWSPICTACCATAGCAPITTARRGYLEPVRPSGGRPSPLAADRAERVRRASTASWRRPRIWRRISGRSRPGSAKGSPSDRGYPSRASSACAAAGFF
jgi:transglycosylase-like protein with SLT domain